MAIERSITEEAFPSFARTYQVRKIFKFHSPGHEWKRPYGGPRRKWINYADKDLAKLMISPAEVLIGDLDLIAGHGRR